MTGQWLVAFPKESHVAGIVGRDGGVRVVVTKRKSDFFRHHKQPGERVHVVPDLKVNELELRYLPGVKEAVIQQTINYVSTVMAPINHCGGCTACCVTLYIKDETFEKRSHNPCPKCTASGCRIYAARPKVCRTFKCLWLKSQGGNDPMPPELRPDRCGAIFTSNSLDPTDILTFEVHPRQGYVIKNGDLAARAIERMQSQGMRAKLITHYNGEQP